MPEAQGFFFQLEKFLLLLPLPFWWVMHRWVIPLFSFLDSANKQPPLTFHLSGGLVSMRDVRTTAFKGSSHVVEVTKMKRSCHLKVHSLLGEGSPVVSGSAFFPVQCHVQFFLQLSQWWRACSSYIHFCAILTVMQPAHYHISSHSCPPLKCRTAYPHPFIAF